MKILAISTLLMIVVASLAVSASAADAEPEGCMVLVDYGNGKVLWTTVYGQESMNAFNVTVKAAEQLGLDLDYSESAYGVFVNGIEGVMGDWPNEWWHFWIWDSIGEEWDVASEGPSSTPAQDIAAIGWSYVMDRADFTSQSPIATPDHKYPWTSMRHDLLSTGASQIGFSGTVDLEWNRDLGNGPISSSVVAAGDRLFVLTSGIYNWTDMIYESPPILSCLDRTGDEVWNATIEGAMFEIASPLIAGGIVVIPSTNGVVYAFNAENGMPQWDAAIGSSANGVTSSPILYRNQIIVGGGDGKLYSFAENGSVLWSTQLSSSIYFSSPSARDGVIYIGSEEGKLHAVAANGTGEIWNLTVGGKVRSAPLLLEDEVVVTYSTYEGIVAVDGGVVAAAYDGEEIWRVDVNATSSSAAETDSGIIVSSRDGLTMVSLSGQVQWKTDLGAPITGSPSVANDTIYAVTAEEQSRLVAVDLTGAVVWSYALEPEQYSMCSPTISDDTLYVTSDNGHVYAISLSETEDTGMDPFVLSAVIALALTIPILVIINYIWRRRRG
ncbi:MAG: PQQ-binding-like beta-propeller repeat protein [Methanomassiliicoccales archaeon]|nr:PQQ-binding-like beta-propeller repeat protein [Methanomassiliicoccales archaeon]